MKDNTSDPPPAEQQQLAAIMFSDMVGFSRQMGADETRMLRINPKFSPEVHKERTPIKDPAVLERHIAALRKAGLK
jgi:hypothetical protein